MSQVKMEEKQSAEEKQSNGKKKITSKQVAAMSGVIFLVLLYLITLAVAILDRSSSGRWFQICLVATIAVPLLIWIYTWMYGKLTNKRTIADWYLGNRDEDEDAEQEE